MIQRIQTIYLFLAALVNVPLLLFPMALLINRQYESIPFYFYGTHFEGFRDLIAQNTTLPLIFLILTVIVLPLINVFLFSNRKRQMRLCFFTILLNAGLLGLIYFYLVQFSQLLDTSVHYQFPVVMPLLSVILNYLAFRGIRKDEILVRSVDRIR